MKIMTVSSACGPDCHYFRPERGALGPQNEIMLPIVVVVVVVVVITIVVVAVVVVIGKSHTAR